MKQVQSIGRLGWLLLTMWAGTWAIAQEATVELSVNQTEVSRGESVQLTFSFKNCEAQIAPPEIKGLRYAFGPAKSTNYSWVNGRQSSQIDLTYTYIVEANTPTIEVQSFTMTTTEGRKSTRPFTIRVLKNGENGTSGSANPLRNREIAMVVDVPKRTVVVGEPLVATLQIYTLMPGLEVREYHVPEFTGFWKEAIEIPNPSFKQRVLNGQRVQVATVAKFVLFPQQTGELVIEGFDLTGYIRTSFFNGKNVSAVSDPVKITVKGLPTPLPADHLGAFQEMGVTLNISETEVKANQAFTVDLNFKGNGNLKFLREPDWNWPSTFEVFDPEVKDRIKIEEAGEFGTRSFHYVVIPRATGTFTLPELHVSWYDVRTGQHVNRTLGGSEFTVIAAEGEAAATMAYNSKSDIQILNQDIRYIQLTAACFEPLEPSSWKKRGWTAGLALGPAQWFFLLWWRRRKKAEANDVRGTRKRQAKSRVRKELRDAHKLTSDPVRFYESLGHGLEAYLLAKLGWSQSQYTRTTALEALGTHAPASREGWRELLEALDLARYAPGSVPAPEALYAQAEKLVDQTEKEWKR